MIDDWWLMIDDFKFFLIDINRIGTRAVSTNTAHGSRTAVLIFAYSCVTPARTWSNASRTVSLPSSPSSKTEWRTVNGRSVDRLWTPSALYWTTPLMPFPRKWWVCFPSEWWTSETKCASLLLPVYWMYDDYIPIMRNRSSLSTAVTTGTEVFNYLKNCRWSWILWLSTLSSVSIAVKTIVATAVVDYWMISCWMAAKTTRAKVWVIYGSLMNYPRVIITTEIKIKKRTKDFSTFEAFSAMWWNYESLCDVYWRRVSERVHSMYSFWS